MEALLVLEDGSAFPGKSLGAAGETIGEVVFNTAMTGYQEVFSDPSYRGQIIVMTYPMIGNYGANTADVESSELHLAGLAVREVPAQHSGVRAQRSLPDLLTQHRITGICEIDTRALTRHLREKGAQMGIISTESQDPASLTARVRAAPRIEEIDLVGQVATRRAYKFRERIDRSFYQASGLPSPGRARRAGRAGWDALAGQANAAGSGAGRARGRAMRLGIVDFGLKASIARLLAAMGAQVTVLPPDTTAANILASGYAGVVLSNGPGDPRRLAAAVSTAQSLMGQVPLLGICLGHQIMGLALGGGIEKLKFGHHGANHPVAHKETRRVFITSQNHNYAVTPQGLDARARVSLESLNDGCIEGLAAPGLGAWSVQFHPEASPGPHDALVHLADFLGAIEARRGDR